MSAEDANIENEANRDTEVLLQVTNTKKVVKSDSPDSKDSYWHTKLKAKNTDAVEWMKIKSTEKFANVDDTFSLRDLVTQHTLSDIVENDVESEMEDDDQ